MDCPPRLIAIAKALYAQNVGLTTGTDDQSRLFIKLVAEQAAFELGPAFGLKSAGPGRPQGPSQIAYTGDPQFGGWRLVDGDGSQSGTKGGIVPNPPWQVWPDQVFIRVDPIDHLKVSTTTPSPRPAPVPAPPTDIDHLMAIVARLNALETRVAMLSDHVVSVDRLADEALHRPYPRYVCKYGPFTLVSKPEGS